MKTGCFFYDKCKKLITKEVPSSALVDPEFKKNYCYDCIIEGNPEERLGEKHREIIKAIGGRQMKASGTWSHSV